jgi:hypothetical protein
VLVAVSIVLLEVGIFLLVSGQRGKFQWLVTERDETPEFDRQALEKFINSSFDPVLGWVRRPNSSGTEQGRHGTIRFHIDEHGSRFIPNPVVPPVVAAFGDSYTFCRQVEDDETWPAQLVGLAGCGVLNFGVGNYGIDQALLRYENQSLPDSVRVVVMGFVPETICRVQSCWKHYLEFGNTFAFKPRFRLADDGDLELLENPVQSLDDFLHLAQKLPQIREDDGFYRRKFLVRKFRFPYLVTLLRRPRSQIPLMLALLLRGMLRSVGLSRQWAEDLPFMLVMQNNIRDSHKLYTDPDATALLRAVLTRFCQHADARGHLPLVLVMPQLLDLKIAGGRGAYADFFAELSELMPVIDLTQTFLPRKIENLYINDQYGGHLSVEGNRIVAQELVSWLRERQIITN